MTVSFSKDQYLPLLVLPVRKTPEGRGAHTAADMAAAHAAYVATKHHMGVLVMAWVGNYDGTAAGATLADGSRLRWNSEAEPTHTFEHVIECCGGTTHRMFVTSRFDINRHRDIAANCPQHPAPRRPWENVFGPFASAVTGRRAARGRHRACPSPSPNQ